MKHKIVAIGTWGLTLIATQGAFSAERAAKGASQARLSTVTCFKKTPDTWREAVLAIYEPFPVGCAEEFKPHAVILTGTFRPVPLNADGTPQEGSSQTPELPMIQYLGQLTRTASGGFEFTSGGSHPFEIALDSAEGKTQMRGQPMGDFAYFSGCTIAPFKNFCGTGKNR